MLEAKVNENGWLRLEGEDVIKEADIVYVWCPSSRSSRIKGNPDLCVVSLSALKFTKL